MSADNYYYICKKDGKYYAPMGFMSSDYAPGQPPIRPHHQAFDTLDEAYKSIEGEYAEYGVLASDEVHADFEREIEGKK